MKYLLIFVGGIAFAAVVFFIFQSGPLVFMDNDTDTDTPDVEDEEDSDKDEEEPSEEDDSKEKVSKDEEVIGKSAGGLEIKAYHFGSGEDEIIFVGGIHGGYSWNTALLAYEIIDHLEDDPDIIPEDLTVTVIPVLNPDGLEKNVGTTGRFEPSDVFGDTVLGRFNDNEVDLNRNFDCNWKSRGTWQDIGVDGGSEPFSEPEAQAFRDYMEENEPESVVVYFAVAGGVYASGCDGEALPETEELMETYAEASGYPAEGVFESYEVSGDVTDWLSKIDIPAISVILSTRDSTEWSKNRRGVEAVINAYDQ